MVIAWDFQTPAIFIPMSLFQTPAIFMPMSLFHNATLSIYFNMVKSYLSSQWCNLSHHKLGFCVCGSCNLFWRKKKKFFTSSSISYPHCRGIVFLRKNKMTVLSKTLLIFTSIKLKGNYVNDLWVIQPASCVKQSSIVLPHFSSAFSKGSFLLCSG